MFDPKIKRILAILLLIALVLSASSCAPDGESGAASATEEPKNMGGAESGEEKPDPRITEMISKMTLREKICQMIVVMPEKLSGNETDTEAGEGFRAALAEYPVGGIIFFKKNIVNREQISSMIRSLQEYSGIPLFIAVDEEGGAVSRIASNPAMGTTAFSSMLEIGNTGDAEKAYEVGATIGREIRELGFNLDFAPVADIFSNPENKVIGARAFGTDAATVSKMVASAVRGFRDGGVLCTLKHFPGHGDTAEDTHRTSAESLKTLAELEACEFLPFKAGIEAGAPLVMLSHILTPNVTDASTPASLSPFMTDYLRNDLRFDGLVITDSLAMRAISDHYSSAEAAVAAVRAGSDLLLIPASLEKAVAGIEEAVRSGAIPEERIRESVERILKYKLEYGILPG